MAESDMVGKRQPTLPVGERHSFGIELEVLVAHLPTKAVDPDQRLAESLPPLLRIDEEREWRATVAVLEHIRQTLREHGVLVAAPVTDFTKKEGDGDTQEPNRLRGLDRWDIGTDETVKAVPSPQDNGDKYRWTGIEIRSPALWAMDSSFDEIKLVVNLLKSLYRLRVNVTCGFHVHVANGRRFFSPKTVKRLGAFLWAADPVLSRLHAPWRRVGSHSLSIRYGSKLALCELKPADVTMMVRQTTRVIRQERHTILDTVPDMPWSDTTREEMDFGGRKGWEEHAQLWREAAPKMTLPEDCNEVSSGPGPNTEPNPSSESRSTSRSRSGSDSGSSSRSSSGSGSTRKSAPALEPDEIDPDAGGAHDRHLLSFMQTDAYLEMCYECTGHHSPRKLSPPEQQKLLALVHCQDLFGHHDLASLSAEEEAEVFTACAPYVETLRSVWRWDPDAERWELDQCRIGDLLTHVRPKQNIKVNMPRVVGRLENVAAMLELDNEADLEYVTRQELDDARQSNKGLEALVTSLRDYVDTPDIDNDSTQHIDEAELEELIERFEREIEEGEEDEVGSQAGHYTPNTDRNDSPQNPDQSSSLPTWPEPYVPGKSTSSSPFMSDVSSPQPPRNSENDRPDSPRNPNPGGSSPSDPHSPSLPPSPPSPPPSAPKRRHRRRHHRKLAPHDVNQLPELYISNVSAHTDLTDADWDRISWLPSSRTHPRHRPDPACTSPSSGPPAHTRTLPGCAAILACGSAAEVGALLVQDPSADDEHAGRRLNYNFEAYAPEGLGERYGYACRRTLEFREAAGSLDPEWIALWARVCVGVARWCRDADPRDYVALLEELARWDDEDRDRDRDREADQVSFDVCDLLDRIGLEAEAEGVRRRERRRGPPR
ncbi:putative amidoligase enzyme-domain-containing protein [Biscogniauxia sp. FL1348]|nr:putative amidoligase enzyme-domain-containing protein [Biscogniauxia sp. FL1348]